MKRRIMQTVAILWIGGILMLGLFGCGGEKYTVDYDGQKSCYENAKGRYPAGAKVVLYYGNIGTDTDYTFYLDGQRVNCTYDERKGFEIAFTMPAHPVKLTCDARNSMIYEPETEPAPYVLLSYETGTCGTDGYDSSRSLTLSTYDGERLLLVRETHDADGAQTAERYAVPYRAQFDCEKLIDSFDLRAWKYLKEPQCIDGGYSTVRFLNDDGSYEQVSTDSMPEDGERQLDQIGVTLSGYATEEYRLAD